jgi:predicted AlkP superfamily phosphohydrolase/phosphomutase
VTGWANIVTGKRATKHGVLEPLEPRPDRQGLRAARRHARLCSAVWDILARNGFACHVVNFPTTHPADASGGGVTVSNLWATATGDDPPDATVHPPEVEATLRPLRIGSGDVKEKSLRWFMPKVAARGDARDPRGDVVAASIAQDHSVHEAILWAMRNVPWEFAAVRYTGLLAMSRAFMQCAPPRLDWVPHADVDRYGRVVQSAYEFLDIMLGQLLEAAGPAASVLVVSDRGFRIGADRPVRPPAARESMDAWRREEAMGVVASPGFPPGSMPDGASVFDVTPTILSLFDLAGAKDMDGRSWATGQSEKQPRKAIASWDDSGAAACAWPDEPDAARDPAEEENVAYLRELGYREQPDLYADFAIRRTLADEQFNLAVSHLDVSAPAEAVELLEPLVAAWPQFAEYRSALARAYRGVGDVDAAEWQEFLARPRTANV